MGIRGRGIAALEFARESPGGTVVPHNGRAVLPPATDVPASDVGRGVEYTTPADRLAERPDDPTRVRVSVIVPALNEAPNLPYVLPRIPTWIEEVLLVDGGSTDGTVEVARALLPRITVLGQERPGKGAALQAGFRAATGDIIVTLDADGSTDPAELPAFVGCLLAGADFVKGSRFVQGGGTDDMGVVRRVGNWMLAGAVRTAFGGRYSDLCYGYNAFWRHVLPLIDGEADGFEIETFLNVRALAAGMKVVEVPSYEGRRVHGLSNLHTFHDGYRVLRTITRERLYVRARRRGAPRGLLSGASPVIGARGGAPRLAWAEAALPAANGHPAAEERRDGGC